MLIDSVAGVLGAAQHSAFSGREAEFCGYRGVRVAVVARDAAAAAARPRWPDDVQLGEPAAGARAVVQQRGDAARALRVRVRLAAERGARLLVARARRAPLQSGRDARVRRRAAAAGAGGGEVLRGGVARRVLGDGLRVRLEERGDARGEARGVRVGGEFARALQLAAVHVHVGRYVGIAFALRDHQRRAALHQSARVSRAYRRRRRANSISYQIIP